MKNNTSKIIESYFQEVKKNIDLLDKKSIEKIIDVVLEAYKKDKNIYILGNGGSASIASHLAADLGKGTLHRIYDNKEKRLRVLSLNDNLAVITAYANDISYEHVFVQQLQNLVNKGDIVIGISGSGNSINILKAISYAKKIGAKTIGLTGFKTGGKLAKLTDLSVIVNSNHYGPIEDLHTIIGHLIAASIASFKKPVNHKRKNKSVPFYIEEF